MRSFDDMQKQMEMMQKKMQETEVIGGHIQKLIDSGVIKYDDQGRPSVASGQEQQYIFQEEAKKEEEERASRRQTQVFHSIQGSVQESQNGPSDEDPDKFEDPVSEEGLE